MGSRQPRRLARRRLLRPLGAKGRARCVGSCIHGEQRRPGSGHAVPGRDPVLDSRHGHARRCRRFAPGGNHVAAGACDRPVPVHGGFHGLGSTTTTPRGDALGGEACCQPSARDRGLSGSNGDRRRPHIGRVSTHRAQPSILARDGRPSGRGRLLDADAATRRHRAGRSRLPNRRPRGGGRCRRRRRQGRAPPGLDRGRAG